MIIQVLVGLQEERLFGYQYVIEILFLPDSFDFVNSHHFNLC